MSIIFVIAAGIVAATAVASLVMELRRDLTMMQQNSYRPDRYLRWLKTSQDTSSVIRLMSMAVFLFGLAASLSSEGFTLALIMVVAAVALAKNAKRKYKKPLVMTRRAWRIFGVQLALSAVIIAAVFFIFGGSATIARAIFLIAMASLGVYCASHIVTMGAVYILAPVEKSINRGYYNDARRHLNAMPDLKVVGITGSYGKTSTKHFLHRILSEQYDTLMTPGSFNTTMGVIRTIREYLKPYNEIFIAEMGAKQKGDIKEISDLVRPQIGIITAVGPQHLESFKTIDNVCATKFELVDALPSDGLAIINNDFAPAAARRVDNAKAIRYAIENTDGADYKVSDIEYSARGTSFTLIDPDGTSRRYTTPLMGRGNISNLTAAIITARALSVSEERISLAVSRMEQVEHRLSVKHTPGGVTILDDAFNSNPAGAEMALDVLSRMTEGRRIIVTPGMVELGDRQAELNREFGRRIAQSADFAIIVNEHNRDAICAGLEDGGMNPEAIRRVDSFAQAQQVLNGMLRRGDTVLYENDLPDTFK